MFPTLPYIIVNTDFSNYYKTLPRPKTTSTLPPPSKPPTSPTSSSSPILTHLIDIDNINPFIF